MIRFSGCPEEIQEDEIEMNEFNKKTSTTTQKTNNRIERNDQSYQTPSFSNQWGTDKYYYYGLSIIPRKDKALSNGYKGADQNKEN
jgi:hypothetical protein